ncbi:hypothetical protein [Pantoea sp. BAV 3049]|uniref:hypothetical protein n=1 Tax=Pantoea sp. BAV 3049 TaxID=2654188 RepID=UPI00131E90D1|nr:hypothetical protein [Pantoea sp. BAV 3049]
MVDFRLTDGKISFTDGLVQYVDGAERIRQQIEFRLSLFRGEWFPDGEFGTPYFQSILAKQATINGAISAIKTQILEVDGVTTLNDFTWSLSVESRVRDVGIPG